MYEKVRGQVYLANCCSVSYVSVLDCPNVLARCVVEYSRAVDTLFLYWECCAVHGT